MGELDTSGVGFRVARDTMGLGMISLTCIGVYDTNEQFLMNLFNRDGTTALMEGN
jgi:hypothetical protein